MTVRRYTVELYRQPSPRRFWTRRGARRYADRFAGDGVRVVRSRWANRRGRRTWEHVR